MRDVFDHLEKGSMIITKYEARFQALSSYSATSISTESQRIKKFLKGLAGFYQLAKTQMVVSGASLQSIVEHTKMIELVYQGIQTGDGAKKIYRLGEFNGHVSQDRSF